MGQDHSIRQKRVARFNLDLEASAVIDRLRRHRRTGEPGQGGIAQQLVTRLGGDVRRRQAFPAKKAMGDAGIAVARPSPVDDQHVAPGTDQLQRCGHAGVAAADDDHVVRFVLGRGSGHGASKAGLRASCARPSATSCEAAGLDAHAPGGRMRA
ncbi:hypothetical protein D3C71_1130140 [compost metagenome]